MKKISKIDNLYKVNTLDKFDIIIHQLRDLKTSICDIQTSICEIKKDIDNIKTQNNVNCTSKDDIKDIQNTLNTINKSSRNMDEHIEFVENIYDIVKHPVSSLLNYYYGQNKEIDNIIVQRRLK